MAKTIKNESVYKRFTLWFRRNEKIFWAVLLVLVVITFGATYTIAEVLTDRRREAQFVCAGRTYSGHDVIQMVAMSQMIRSINAAMTVSSAGQGSVLGSAQLLVPIQQFYTLPAAIIQQVATIAGISMSPEELAAIGIPHTQNIKAFTYFGQALDALDAGNWQEAQNLFAMALEEDPDFELARRGADTTPKFDSPGIGDLRTMPVRELAILVMNEVELAQKMQDEANASADMDTKGGGGGGY